MFKKSKFGKYFLMSLIYAEHYYLITYFFSLIVYLFGLMHKSFVHTLTAKKKCICKLIYEIF